MVKITVERFKELWENSEASTAMRFYLSAAAIQEWIKHGKFPKIKEYCQQLPYLVEMVCLAPDGNYDIDNNNDGKLFGFVFQTKEDCLRFGKLVDILRTLRSCVKVERLAFEEITPCEPESSFEIPEFIPIQCPLVI